MITVMTLSVFVYGTLKPGGRYHQQYCGQHSPEIIPAVTRGKLYDFPQLGYPAMTVGEGWVKGTLFRFSQPAHLCQQILQKLDALEGYRPQPIEIEESLSGHSKACRNNEYDDNEYERVLSKIFSRDYTFLQVAWVYRMSDHLVDSWGGVLVPDGDWSAS